MSMSKPKIMIVTGANTGIGLAVVRRLCQQFGEQAVVYLTARNAERGQAAVEQLQQEGLSPAFHLLDVAADESVEAFAQHIRQTHGGVDVVISNAAARILPDVPQAEQVENFINTNNHGTYRMIQAFGPLLNDGARFLVIASGYGTLRSLNPALHPRFEVDTMEQIEQVMDEYAAAVKAGTDEAEGWPNWMNIPSKVGQVATTRIFARQMAMGNEARRRDILINAMCPGLVDTEASRPFFPDFSLAKSTDDAAVDVVWLATLPPNTTAPYGELVQATRRLIAFS